MKKATTKRLPKTIDITAKEWFDKAAGNSYFSARIVVNHRMKSEKTFTIPFQYGYGDQYQFESMKELVKKGVLPEAEKIFELAPWRYEQNTGVVIRCNKIENCKKKDLIEFGTL